MPCILFEMPWKRRILHSSAPIKSIHALIPVIHRAHHPAIISRQPAKQKKAGAAPACIATSSASRRPTPRQPFPTIKISHSKPIAAEFAISPPAARPPRPHQRPQEATNTLAGHRPQSHPVKTVLKAFRGLQTLAGINPLPGIRKSG